MTYRLAIEEYPTYLHCKANGEHSAANVLRFLEEAYAACVKRERTTVLLELDFTGPSLDAASIFGVISQRVADGTKLRRIAYVDASSRNRKEFAANVASNRGVNVRLFPDVASARQWIEGG
jgi:hypothetical protein